MNLSMKDYLPFDILNFPVDLDGNFLRELVIIKTNSF